MKALGALIAVLIAGPFFAERISPESLQAKYEDGRAISVLIVPGHNADQYGTSFQGVSEGTLNVALGYELWNFFKADTRFSSTITHDRDGTYAEWFDRYMLQNRAAILSFKKESTTRTADAVSHGYFLPTSTVEHNPAADNTALALYGINKLANNYAIDVVLHIHFNDYPRGERARPGRYRGFAMYIPENQLPNARVSRAVAGSIYAALKTILAPSDLPGERDGIVEDQGLIAVGSNASRDGASVLLEYSYIYEPSVQNAAARPAFLRELAYETYRGVKTYFEPDAQIALTTLLPHTWTRRLKEGDRGEDVLALQRALIAEGLYPPAGSTLRDCPMSGYYGSCTARAAIDYQPDLLHNTY